MTGLEKRYHGGTREHLATNGRDVWGYTWESSDVDPIIIRISAPTNTLICTQGSVSQIKKYGSGDPFPPVSKALAAMISVFAGKGDDIDVWKSTQIQIEQKWTAGTSDPVTFDLDGVHVVMQGKKSNGTACNATIEVP